MSKRLINPFQLVGLLGAFIGCAWLGWIVGGWAGGLFCCSLLRLLVAFIHRQAVVEDLPRHRLLHGIGILQQGLLWLVLIPGAYTPWACLCMALLQGVLLTISAQYAQENLSPLTPMCGLFRCLLAFCIYFTSPWLGIAITTTLLIAMLQWKQLLPELRMRLHVA